MRYALLEGRHEHRKDFREMEDIEGLAQEAGLDMDQFRKDMADPNILDLVAEDHAKAQELAVFGTPTFVFENGEKFFLRIKAPDNSEQAARTFDGLYKVFVEQPNIDEVKRPHKVD